MEYAEYRHESEKTHSSLFVICFLCVFICAAALGTLRLYGLYLEHRISETASKIEVCKEKNLDMSKRYSELLSPARIYSYAREELGMMNAEQIMTVKLSDASVNVAGTASNGAQEEREGLLAFLNPFVRRAHAKN